MADRPAPALPQSAPLSRRRILKAAAALPAAILPAAALTEGARAGTVALDAAPDAAGDALWIWGTGHAEWPAVAATMAREGFRTAYLSVPPGERPALAASRTALEDSLAPFAERGIAVWLAGGAPGWADGRPLPAALDGLLGMAALSDRVTGIQLDVEPYTLPLWRSGEEGRTRIAAAFTALLGTAHGRLRDSGRRLGTILHPSFIKARLPAGAGGGSMAAGAIGHADSVTIMAYRNSTPETADFAAGLLAELDADPRPWRFGITVQAGPEQDRISYAGADYGRVRADMAVLGTLARRRPCGTAYRGVAVHAYASLLPLLRG